MVGVVCLCRLSEAVIYWCSLPEQDDECAKAGAAAIAD
ncbi:hypothetical protein imdm_2093 [gamma proteobacterium IMCC2047]|nr:hypothetical protein imdm_2093 [gamma proteobacterium IMCC2047]